jgi:hypothetical protein
VNVVGAVLAILLLLAFVVGSIAVTFGLGWVVFASVRGMWRLAVPSSRPPTVTPVAAAPARDAPPPPPEVWAQARQEFDELRAEYAAYECDPVRVLRLPALADVSVPSTARFVDAFAEAQGLQTDAYPGPEHAPQFVSAVDRARRTWAAAQDAADRIRLNGLPPAERGAVERVVKLLTIARDSDSEPERLAAYARARSELARLERAGVLHVPLPARAALDVASRGQLPPGSER